MARHKGNQGDGGLAQALQVVSAAVAARAASKPQTGQGSKLRPGLLVVCERLGDAIEPAVEAVLLEAPTALNLTV